ncbi:MAG: hypothetical protein H6643_11655 [Caldilineaceae bacterium]|nr:hypothetical protein [Caldilineaceae bacterium]
MTSTEIAAIIVGHVAGDQQHPAGKGESSAITMTAGTNRRDLVGELFARALCYPCASCTMRTIREVVLRPTWVARKRTSPSVLIVAPMISSPDLADGHGLASDHRFIEGRAAVGYEMPSPALSAGPDDDRRRR